MILMLLCRVRITKNSIVCTERSSNQSIGRNNSIAGLFLAEICFLVSFALSLFGDKTLSLIMFVTAWISMTFMKLITTPAVRQSRTQRDGRRIGR